MKKYLFLAAFALFASAACFAQDVTKQVVNVEGFTYNNSFSLAECNTVRNNVIQSLQATKRVIVVDLAQQSSVKTESERRKSEDAINDNHSVSDMTQLNANYIIKGTLNSITVTKENSKNPVSGQQTVYYHASMNYTIQLINPANGATEGSYTYESTGMDNNSADVARQEAISGSSANMNKFIEEAFPVKGTIVQVAEGDSKKAKTVYINLGSDQGIQKGQKFIVYSVVEIAGEKAEKEIGTLTANEVMSKTRTICKVNNGGDVIAANLASKTEMTIKTRAKKENLFSGFKF